MSDYNLVTSGTLDTNPCERCGKHHRIIPHDAVMARIVRESAHKLADAIDQGIAAKVYGEMFK